MTHPIAIERLTEGNQIEIPGFGPAEVYRVRFDGEGYSVDYCTNDRAGWDALDTHYVDAGESVEHALQGEPPYLRSEAAVTFEEWEAKAAALNKRALEAPMAKMLEQITASATPEQEARRVQLYVAMARALGVPVLHLEAAE